MSTRERGVRRAQRLTSKTITRLTKARRKLCDQAWALDDLRASLGWTRPDWENRRALEKKEHHIIAATKKIDEAVEHLTEAQ